MSRARTMAVGGGANTFQAVTLLRTQRVRQRRRWANCSWVIAMVSVGEGRACREASSFRRVLRAIQVLWS